MSKTSIAQYQDRTYQLEREHEVSDPIPQPFKTLYQRLALVLPHPENTKKARIYIDG